MGRATSWAVLFTSSSGRPAAAAGACFVLKK
jgi:hypothetical protein